MLKNIIGGIAVGIANVIPGVSGGTMMVILGIFNPLMDAISNLFKLHNPDRVKDLLFLVQVLFGAAIGLIGFANVLTFLFDNFPTQTMFWFVGLVGFSIPVFWKNEAKNDKVNFKAMLAGVLLIFLIKLLAPASDGNVNPAFPPISLMYLIKMYFVGIIGGATMLLPGVSGSMVMLILGEYYLFKSLLANALSFELIVLVPLAFLGLGILSGIILSAKLTKKAMEKNHEVTINFLLGLIIASTIVLIPVHVTYDFSLIATSLFAVLFGGFMVWLLERFV